MNSNPPTNQSSTPLSLQSRIESECDRFAQQWTEGGNPEVGDFLEGWKEPHFSRLLRELLRIDLSNRIQAGNQPEKEDYEQRFPEHHSIINEIFMRTIIVQSEDQQTPRSHPDTHCGSVQDEPAAQDQNVDHGAATPSGEDTAAEAGPPSTGSIGSYEVQDVLGSGGFGTVYLGYDKALDRRVAIKVPRRDRLARSEDAEAFLNEARVLAKVEHPGIVPIYQFGQTDDGRCYVVSKFIEGKDLYSLIEEGRPSYIRTAEIVAPVAEALHHAHKKRLVHRDIKPANILMDADGKPYVADFGLALKEEDYGKGSGYAGTPAYMSPEQARGEGHLVDGRSDIFSLGVVLYELLTGIRPFRGSSWTQVADGIIKHDPRPPRQRDDTIPRELERICLKAIAKRASDRYTTALDMADDLWHFLRNPHESQMGSRLSDYGSRLGSDLGSRMRSDYGGQQRGSASRSHLSRSESRRSKERPTSQRQKSTRAERPESTESTVDQPTRIVPKGLRPFTSDDADFFLELLPGPVDRDGLPQVIRFWKSIIEGSDSAEPFRVGILYGPSGCGKSSLVSAGLLPRLSRRIVPVHVESTVENTESRLLRALRKTCPDLAPDSDLSDAIAALRRGQAIPTGRRVLIVLDQFEQWLHGNRDQEDSELARAIRQCDGSRVQCLLMVRDDFWLAVSRFMHELEVRVVEGRNSGMIDLWDVRHAQAVLAAFGRAYGALPEDPQPLSKEQIAFIEQSIAGLAQEGKVIPVRLSLFAEMVKGKPWTPATLKAIGGAEGVRAAFLEETFSASTAPPEHRLHQAAARKVLRALLPDAGSNIKGHMRSETELLELSGYANRPRDFEGLLRILDSETRLLTPTDPEASDEDELPASPNSSTRYYQLTHDYLVPSLRDWLQRKQRETMRGRAQIRLDDRTALWRSTREDRQLPSLIEFLNIRALVPRSTWTDAQRAMMKKAASYYSIRSTAALVLVTLLVLGGRALSNRVTEAQRGELAAGLVDRIADAETVNVPVMMDEVQESWQWVGPLLSARLNQMPADSADDLSRQRLNLSMTLLEHDPTQVPYLVQQLIDATVTDFPVLSEFLRDHRNVAMEEAWSVLERQEENSRRANQRKLRAARVIATYIPESDRGRLKPHVGFIARELTEEVLGDSSSIRGWLAAFQPVARMLYEPLMRLAKDEEIDSHVTFCANQILTELAEDDPVVLGEMIPFAYARQFQTIFEKLQQHPEQAVAVCEEILRRAPDESSTNAQQDRLASGQANSAVALFQLGHADQVWPLLKHSPNPSLRSYLIHRLYQLGSDGNRLAKRLLIETDTSIRRALLLALGEYRPTEISESARDQVLDRLGQWYLSDPDGGVHGAVQWLAEQWGATPRLAAAGTLPTQPTGDHRWFVNKQGQTMIILEPDVFLMGSPEREEHRFLSETLHRREILHRLAIAATETTFEQFGEFIDDQKLPLEPFLSKRSEGFKSPQSNLYWYVAARYCNWLSDQEGLTRCYEPNEEGKYAAGMRPVEGYQTLDGYRLPSVAEWEYACRAGALTSRYYGNGDPLLAKYAWYKENSSRILHEVGQLKPNDFGLFDMHGNVFEWCHNQQFNFPSIAYPENQDTYPDLEDRTVLDDTKERMLRGAAMGNSAEIVRAALRYKDFPTAEYKNDLYGLRVVRTLK